MRRALGFLVMLLAALLLAACGASSSGGSGSTSGDWFYHWNCNGDSECLATNPTGAASGTLDEGPVEVNCTQILQFGQNFWGSAATQSCDQNSNGSGGGGGSSAPAISGFSPASTAPGNSLTITGSNFPSSVTVTINGLACAVTSVTSTQIVCTLPAMGNFTGTFTVTASGGSATSASSLAVVNHFYGVSAAAHQFVAVGGNGTLETSPDGTTWSRQTSGTGLNLYAAAWSGSAFVAVGQTGTVIRSTDGINWTHESLGSLNGTDLFAVIWNGAQFAAIGDTLAVFTSPDGITWTENSASIGSTYGGLAWSGSEYVAVGGVNKGSPTIIKSANASTWTTVSTTAPNGNQLLAAAYGNGKFVAVGEAETVVTSPDGATWTARPESEAGDLQGVVWSGTQFVVVGFDVSVGISVILTSPDGVTWTSRSVSLNGRSLNAVTFGNSEYVAVGGFGIIVTSLDGISWTVRTP